MPARQDQPTQAELRALRAYLEAGSARAAALEIGCSEQTVKNHLHTLRQKYGVKRTFQVVYLLRDKLAA
jgi:DNA-binding CsgD family transcriptional regulator